MTRARSPVFGLALLVAAGPVALTAEASDHDAHRHVRTTDPRLHGLLHEGLRISHTLRALVHRLHQSDVVVYLDCDGAVTPPGGRLTFVSAAGGYRYVHVRVSPEASRNRQIALIAHELRHAVEIADAPDIVDGPSLAVAYGRIRVRQPQGGRAVLRQPCRRAGGI